jgi:ABC-2 type transport system permease protein
MTNARPDRFLTPLAGRDPSSELSFERGFSLSAVWALFWLTVRQHCRARRLFVLAALFLMPAAIAVGARYTEGTLSKQALKTSDLEFALLLTLIPHALAPLAALLYASGMIQDEIEDQTLTYLLVRPLPKWSIYLSKFLATLFVTTALAGFFTLVTYLAIYLGRPEASLELILGRAGKGLVILTLSLFAYCAVFGFMSLVAKRSLVAGVAYIIIFEGLLANIDFAVRRLTVMYYFRVLSERWNHLDISEWSLNLNDVPSSAECLVTLLAAGLMFVFLGAITFSTREFRLKTPEGS